MSRPREISDERIFQGVYQALSKVGYAKLTLDKIAAEINISPAALSKRFGSKKSLLLAYSDYVIQVTKQTFLEVQSLYGHTVEALKNIFIQTFGQVNDPQTLANITSLYIEGAADSDLLERSRLRLQHIDEQVQIMLRGAIEAKEIKECDTEKISKVLQSALGGSLMIWLKEPERSLEEWVNDCFEVVLGPLRK